jgi:hypothetical protein
MFCLVLTHDCLFHSSTVWIKKKNGAVFFSFAQNENLISCFFQLKQSLFLSSLVEKQANFQIAGLQSDVIFVMNFEVDVGFLRVKTTFKNIRKSISNAKIKRYRQFDVLLHFVLDFGSIKQGSTIPNV